MNRVAERRRLGFARFGVLAITLVAVLAGPGAAWASSTPPVFGAAKLIDRRAPFPPFGSEFLSSISCGSPTSCVAVGGKVAQFTTDAGSGTPTWSQAEVITPGSLSSVSCPTSSLCVAIAGSTALRSTDGGRTWSAPVTIAPGIGTSQIGCDVDGYCVVSGGPSDYVSPDGGQTWSGPDSDGDAVALSAISCLPSGVCVAINASNHVLISSDIEAPGLPTWTRYDGFDNFLTDLSCTANGICVTVDTFGYAYISTNINSPSPTWSKVLVDGTGSTVDGLVGLTSVSCTETAASAEADTCVAGDFQGSTAISTDVGLPGTSTWSIVPTFNTGNLEPVDEPIPGSPFYAGLGFFYPLVCVNTGWCLASDIIGNVTYGVVPPGDAAATAWSPPTTLNGFDYMNAVGCSPDGQICAALDTTGHAVASVDGGADWSPPELADPAKAAGAGPASSTPDSVSCVDSGQCVAIEQSFDPSGLAYTSVLTSTPTAAGATWTAAQLDLTETVNGVATGALADGVSCVDGGLCVVVDTADRSVISTDFGQTWTVVPTTDSSPLIAVSCGSTTLCVAVDGAGRSIVSTNPAAPSHSWSAPLTIDANPLSAVSCTAQGLCAAVDNTGHVMISNSGGSVWSKAVAIPSAAALVSVSCTISALCVAIDAAGHAYDTINPSAASPTWTLAGSNTTQLTAISCVGSGLCVGVDDVGDAEVAISQVGKATLSGAGGGFPSTIIATASAPQTVKVTNTGSAPLNVVGATLAGADAGQFAITASSCTGTFVPPGGSCSVSFEFTPASPGAYSAASLLITSDAGTSPDQVALSGTGVLGPVLSLTGGPIVFPSTAVGSVSPVHQVTATNTGGAPLTISVAALTGADAGQFKLTAAGGCARLVIAPTASCSVGVEFAPTATGGHAASLELDGNAQPAQNDIGLSGTGLSAPAAVNAFSFVELKAGKKGVITAELKLPRAGSFSLSTTSMIPATKAAKTAKSVKTAKTATAAKTAKSAKTAETAKTTKAVKTAKPAKAKRITYSAGVHAAIKGPTTATVKILPGKAAAAALKADKTLRVVVSATFTPAGAARRTKTSSVTVRDG